MAECPNARLELADGDLSALLGSALTDVVPWRELVSLCDTVGGRLAGTPGGEGGERWAARVLRAAGLSRVRRQPFRTATWSRGGCEVTLLPSGETLASWAHGFAPASADATAEVIEAGWGVADDFARLGRRVRGRFVLLRDGGPPDGPRPHRSRKYAMAVEAGAAGMLLTSSLTGNRPQTGMCAEAPGPIPSVGITLEDGERLRRALGSGTRVRARVRLVNVVGESTVANVLGDLPGSELAEEVVVIGGHLDSWDVAQGAMDNAAGCAVVLGAARALAALPRRPRRTIRFAMWAAEEIGIIGSREYVHRAWGDLGRHVAYLNYDMPGDPKKLCLSGRKGQLALLEPLSKQLLGLGVCAPASDSVCMATDLRPFLLAGVPCLTALGPHDSGNGCYHSVSDTVDKVDAGILRRASACAAAMAFAIADAPAPPFPRASRLEVEETVRGLGPYDGALEDHDWLVEG